MAKYSDKRDYDDSDEYVDISSGRPDAVNKRKKGSFAKSAAVTLLSIVFIIAGAGMLYYYSILNSVNVVAKSTSGDSSLISVDTEDSELGNTSASSEFSIDSFNNGKLMNDSNVLNILLIGEDNRHEAEYGRTDTMIVLTIDNNNKELKLTSFMRDLWVNIPDYGMQRINVAYTVGGAPKTVATIESNFGIDIDRYAIVDFASFKKIIDVLGGLDIKLTDEEIDYINWQTWKNGQADTRYEIQAEPGIVHLNGRQALWHARNRGQEGICSGSDFTRTQRQRNVLKTLMKEFKDASITQIIGIANEVGPLITTDLSYSEITVLVANALTYLKYDVCEFRLPTDTNYGDVITSGGAWVLVVNDWNQARNELVDFVFNAQKDKISSDDSF
ncbi:MAG: LCP family protein [Clostridiales bacterium]|nr:LCP family protein [Clostridiales bacterium]